MKAKCLTFSCALAAIILLNFFLSKTVLADNADLHFRSLLLEDGLQSQHIKTIVEDELGRKWIGGADGLSIFDGYSIKKVDLFKDRISNKNVVVSELYVDSNQKLWVGTHNNGLYKTSTKNPGLGMEKIAIKGERIRELLEHDGKIFLATNLGLEVLNLRGEYLFDIAHSEFLNAKVPGVVGLSVFDENQILLASYNTVFLFRVDDRSVRPVFKDKLKDSNIASVDVGADGDIWISTEAGIFYSDYSGKSSNWVRDLEGMHARGVIFQDSNIWVKTYGEGIAKLAENNQAIFYESRQYFDSSLVGNFVTDFLVDSNNVIWVSTFSNGISFADYSSSKFGRRSLSAYKDFLGCQLDTSSIYYVGELSKNSFLIGMDSKSMILDKNNKRCFLLQNNYNTKADISILDVVEIGYGAYLLAASNGVYKLGCDATINCKLTDVVEGVYASQALQFGKDVFVATSAGLHRFSSSDLSVMEVIGKETRFNSISISSDSTLYAATENGLAKWSKDDGLLFFVEHKKPYTIIYATSSSEIFLGSRDGDLLLIDAHGNVIKNFRNSKEFEEVTEFRSFLSDDNGSVWIGTNNGLIRYSPDTDTSHRFVESDGLQGNIFTPIASKGKFSGKLYFSGVNGWNEFYPEEIVLNQTPPNVILTGVTRFGREVTTNTEEFQLPTHPEYLESITFTHDDYVFGFEFAGIHFADPSRNQYAYQMEGFDPDWTYTDADNRRVTYTNLPWDDYTFRVKAANKDGIWNEEGLSLAVTVLSPLWARWWAFVIYAIALIGAIIMYGQLRARAANKRAVQLEKQVQYRTQEISNQAKEIASQKRMIEQLLEKKETLFANVSHEFRTPLTLIMGPVEKMLADPALASYQESNKVVLRNAQRLLHLVEQLLKLSQVSAKDQTEMESVDVSEVVAFAIESFRPLAQEKHIVLDSALVSGCTVTSLKESIETIVTNLISNAIKYTPAHGTVRVAISEGDDSTIVSVSDTGSGISPEDQDLIFDRFTRLQQHAETQGTGIGLAMVKELVEAQGGTIQVRSAVGEGSEFIVELPNSAVIPESDAMQFDESEDSANGVFTGDNTGGASRDIKHQGARVLVVDDYPDMRGFITDSLSPHFACETADNGKSGIEAALQEPPDIIVSDVMMPQMDGFEFSRRIRSDERLSHIPIILLTAKGDKDSRMQGWEAYVDEYLTKPFHPDELLMRIDAMLEVRSLLRDQVRDDISKAGRSAKLNQKDQAFVDKLLDIFAKRFNDPKLNRADIASAMAVSDRQLQRKLKALIGQNPSEMLRDYRLKQAIQLLEEGNQVSIVADMCGFGSPSQFIALFKKKHGMTPKQFQMQ